MIAIVLLAAALNAKPVPFDGAALSRSVSAVLDLGGPDARVQLIETDSHGVEGLRILKVGDDYRDGWKLAALTPQEAVLRKAGKEEHVCLGGRIGAASPAPRLAMAAPTPPPPAAQAATLSNAGGRLTGPRTPAVSQAVAKGDAKAVLAAGGSYNDAVDAIRNLTRDQVRTNRPNLATYLSLFGDTSDGSTFNRSSLNGREAITRYDVRGNPTMTLTLDGAYAITVGQSPQQAIIAQLPPQAYSPPPTALPEGATFGGPTIRIDPR